MKALAFGIVIFCQYAYPQTHPQEASTINDQRYQWFWSQRMFPEIVVPNWVRLQSIQTMQQMTAPPSATWTSIGPQPLNNAGIANAGRVWALAVNPQNPAIVYAGTDGGGVWKTVNAGVSWAPISDNQASLGITSLALD